MSTYAFDALGRQTTNAVLGVTTNSFTYDGAGDRLTLTDGKNQTTTWTYDVYGNASNKVDAAGNLIFVYKYDPDNRLTNRWSIAKGTTVYRYDNGGNLTNIDYSAGTVYTPSIFLAYDVLNRLTNMVDAVGDTAYSYDNVGELLSENGPWSNDTVSYTYANRLRIGMSLSQPGGSWAQSYSYDSVRRLGSVISPAGEFDYTYSGSGPSTLVSRLGLPNGSLITNTYDSVARMLSTKLLKSDFSILDSQSYGYNQASQRIAETNTAGDFRNYTYDNASELKTAIGKEAGGTTNRLLEQLGYAYDAAGNLDQRTNNALIQSFGVNDLNELTNATRSGTLTVAGTTTTPATNVTVNGLTANHYADATFALGGFSLVDGTNTFTAIAQDSYGRVDTNTSVCYLPSTNSYSYDLNGNLLSDGNRNFLYDDENQLIGVSVANVYSNNFVYDGKFRRRVEKDYAWQSGAWVQTNEVHFVYDGNEVIQERDANNNPVITYTRSRSSLLARTDNGQEIPGSPTTAYYHRDGNGNVTCLIYTNQLIAARYLYDPFGNTLSLSGPLAEVNVYRFASKEWLGNAGLYYFVRRYYDPSLQRFINRDPLAEQGGINLYTYVANNPVNAIDPLGLWPCWLQNLWNALGNLTDNLGNGLFGPDSGYNPLYDPNNPDNLLNPLSPYYIDPNLFNNGPFSPNLSTPNNQPSLFNPNGSPDIPLVPFIASLNIRQGLSLIPNLINNFLGNESDLPTPQDLEPTPPAIVEPAGTFGGETVATGSGTTLGEGVTGFTVDSGTLMETTTGTLIEGTAVEAGGEGTVEIIIVIIAGAPVGM